MLTVSGHSKSIHFQQMTFPRFVYAADLDGDDNKDVLSVSQGDTKVVW